jgi:hypothetical protein
VSSGLAVGPYPTLEYPLLILTLRFKVLFFYSFSDAIRIGPGFGCYFPLTMGLTDPLP